MCTAHIEYRRILDVYMYCDYRSPRSLCPLLYASFVLPRFITSERLRYRMRVTAPPSRNDPGFRETNRRQHASPGRSISTDPGGVKPIPDGPLSEHVKNATRRWTEKVGAVPPCQRLSRGARPRCKRYRTHRRIQLDN